MEQCCIFKLIEEIQELYFAENEGATVEDFHGAFFNTAKTYAQEHNCSDKWERIGQLVTDGILRSDLQNRVEQKLEGLIIETELVCLSLFDDEKCPEKIKERWQQMLRRSKDELMMLRLRML